MSSINLNGTEPCVSTTYTGTAGNTPTFSGSNRVVVWTTTDAHVAAGVAAVATVNDLPLPAFTPVILEVTVADAAAWRVSAIQIASGGNVYAKAVAVVD